MGPYVLTLPEIDASQVGLVGGKAAHLGELSRIEGIHVPPGFCVTVAGYRRIVAGAPWLDEAFDALSRLRPDDHEAIRTLAARVRATLEVLPIPREVADPITHAVAALGEETPCAVRSSATAEDLPTASFAGQHNSYLGVSGGDAILAHVSRCWASLFTERAVTYRLRNGFAGRRVEMAVVVQRMVDPRASGVLFTADPVSGNRGVASVEAVEGLGETLVSGMVTPDVYSVRGSDVVSRRLARQAPVLMDDEVVRLAGLGRRIETHFGRPQDIEWCLDAEGFRIVQSRPITTLFPIPQTDDGENHVYLSVGHQQMMTDAMKPLGISVWQMTAARPMYTAGGRLFVDVTAALASPAAREALLDGMGKFDPLMRDALQTILDRGDFIRELPQEGPGEPPRGPAPAPAPLETDPAIVTGLMQRTQASIAALERAIAGKSGLELLDFILADLGELKRHLFDAESHQAVMAGFEATWWLNEKLQEWLGEKNAADTLAQSVPHNVTSEMGLALLDVADAIRPHPEVVACLERVEDEDFLERLPELRGGREARDAIQDFLRRYGMRCVGEIDITRPRWSERPSMLLPVILGNVRSFAPGAAARRFEQGRQEARRKEEEILKRLRALPDGEAKAEEVERYIRRLRVFVGYREFPKYGMISRYFVYRRALLGEARRLVREGVIAEEEDVFHLTFDELREVVRSERVDEALVRRRKEEFRSFQALTPPRVLTSDGEALNGTYRREDLPPGALLGLGVSAGTVEGRARVVHDMAEADLEAGDILVTTFTDPSFTPLFVAIAGLVTEVGGQTTHGAVIAREYGLPAVVGVDGATRRIRDGQRIRVHGTEGYVEILEEARPRGSETV